MPKKKAEENKPAQKISKEDFEVRVLELAEKGMTSEKIGETLRREGIHRSKEYGKISKILKAKNLYHVPEIKNMQERLAAVTAHSEKNRQDKRSMRERERILALLRRQEQYNKIA